MKRTVFHGAAHTGSAPSKAFVCALRDNARLWFALVVLLMLTACCADRAFAAEYADMNPGAIHASVRPYADARSNTAIYQVWTMLPTYPIDTYLTTEIDPTYNWQYKRFDRERFLLDDPQPVNRLYRLIVLENDLLRVFIMPEMGGRIWQVIHKPTGKFMFYQNSVVKPSPWGPANQTGWTGLGGMEWNLPVVEHGYDWGTPWDAQTFHAADGTAVAILSTPDDGRYLSARIEVRLPANAAYFEVVPHIQNISETPLDFDYWENAMLAPGNGYHPSPELRFILPGEAVRIHSTGDQRLPASDSIVPWPVYRTRDLSRLGDWDQYLGFFEYPAAHGPFAGVYDPVTNTGAVRVYPADVARGSKVFGLGWNDALTSEYYSDDGSAYVELHGGIAATFADRAHLDTGEAIGWREYWYPVVDVGPFVMASEAGALSWQNTTGGASFGFYPTESFAGRLVVKSPSGREITSKPITATAGVPTVDQFESMPQGAEEAGRWLEISLENASGAVVLSGTVDSP